MMGVDRASPSPGSPPGMTASKSSKSSLNSLSSDDNSVLADVKHFEDIDLKDEVQLDARHMSEHFKSAPNPHRASFSSDLRAAALKQQNAFVLQRLDYSSRSRQVPTQLQNQRRDLPPPLRNNSRPRLPSSTQATRSLSVQTTGLGATGFFEPPTSPLRLRHLAIHSSQILAFRRHRSPSPAHSLSLAPDNQQWMYTRRRSWQSSRGRKSALELELECDEDDGDYIPDGLILDNVPISPRPPVERAKSQPCSKAPSPERSAKDRVRSVGNGTPAVAVAQGSFRSPSWKPDTINPRLKSAASSGLSSPVNVRAKSWIAALADLNAEAKALTEKLEEHAGWLEYSRYQRSRPGSMPVLKRSATNSFNAQPSIKSTLAEIPPLRRINIMIDPLPISKEKEAVLSRTRPSWLPPKDPAEERRHLKEYQKMMAQSMQNDRRKEAAKRARSECRDTAADNIMHLWEDDIIPRWYDAIRERTTRELWWRGIAPRSRGAVWTKAIGNQLGLSATSYKAALDRAETVDGCTKTGHALSNDAYITSWFEAIRKDVQESTWEHLKIFQVGGPLHQSLMDVLRAYVMYRSDIGYVPGCNTIAALLLINLPSATDAFIALANLLNRPLPLSFCASDVGAKTSAYNLLLQNLGQKSASLRNHLVKLPDHDPNVYLSELFLSLFTHHLAVDEAARLWDVYVFEGDALLIHAGVAMLLNKEMALLGTKSVEEVRETLMGQARSPSGSSKMQRLLGAHGEEDKWMRSVRQAGCKS